MSHMTLSVISRSAGGTFLQYNTVNLLLWIFSLSVLCAISGLFSFVGSIALGWIFWFETDDNFESIYIWFQHSPVRYGALPALYVQFSLLAFGISQDFLFGNIIS